MVSIEQIPLYIKIVRSDTFHPEKMECILLSLIMISFYVNALLNVCKMRGGSLLNFGQHDF
ncbi:unknown protein [Paenibacillus amylolyticus]|uniref:Uncharacterized protein n=1 Tax=Paenibacillus amylolyticus TaxID=1451 RepID=A0A100VRR6_PAEAM|nr:unknown protein [Paenibacillus amylolyticus]